MASKYLAASLAAIVGILLLPVAAAQVESAETSSANNRPTVRESYLPVGRAAPDQAKLVYYRAATDTKSASGANVYVDQRFHASLQPAGFTVFCLAPGAHFIGAFTDDAPLYRGKHEQLYRVELEAGSTYFVRTSTDGSGAPVSVERDEAERELHNARNQVRFVSRAPTQPCK